MLLTMTGSSLSSREVTSRFAVVTASEQQSPSLSTPNEVQPPIAEWKSLNIGNGPIQTGDSQKNWFYNTHTPLVPQA